MDAQTTNKIKIPERIIQHRPFYKGMPIPFSNYIFPDGTPDFRVLDPVKTEVCLRERGCGICGVLLDPEIVFTGGPLCREGHIFTDPAMHEECARYAYAVCPYLLGDKGHTQNFKPKQNGPQQFSACPHASNIRPEKMFLFFTTGYRLGRLGTLIVALSDPFHREVEM